MQESSLSSFTETVRKGGAPPKAAAGYAAGVFYLWGEAILRYLWTNVTVGNLVFGNVYLYNARTGDVSAIWLLSVVVALIGFLLFYFAFRKRERVGSITLWTAVLVVSAIVAPMVGELGTPFGV